MSNRKQRHLSPAGFLLALALLIVGILPPVFPEQYGKYHRNRRLFNHIFLLRNCVRGRRKCNRFHRRDPAQRHCAAADSSRPGKRSAGSGRCVPSLYRHFCMERFFCGNRRQRQNTQHCKFSRRSSSPSVSCLMPMRRQTAMPISRSTAR